MKKDVNDQFDEEYEKMNDWENVNAIEVCSQSTVTVCVIHMISREYCIILVLYL